MKKSIENGAQENDFKNSNAGPMSNKTKEKKTENQLDFNVAGVKKRFHNGLGFFCSALINYSYKIHVQ